MLLGNFSLKLLIIFFLFCIFSVLITVWQGDFLFYSNFFGVLCAYCAFMGMSFFKLGNFSHMILWKNTFWAFNLKIFSFLYFYYSKIWFFHSVPDFLDVLCQETFRFNYFFDPCIHFFLSCFHYLRFSPPSLIFYWWSFPL